MAIPITDVAGSTVYLAAQGAVITSAVTAETAITAGKEILDLIELGDSSETKTVTDYTTIEGVDAQKSIGAKSYGNMSLTVLYNSADVDGQKDIVDMWNDGTRRTIIVKLTETGTSPTYVFFEIALSALNMTFTKDGAVQYVTTAEQTSARELVAAV